MRDVAAALPAFGYEVHRVDGWIESARSSLNTATAQRIAEAAVSTSPLAWRDR
nr:hypothetical protein [Micromonospora sp. DSM 115978]